MTREDVKKRFSATELRKMADEVEATSREEQCRQDVLAWFRERGVGTTSFDAGWVSNRLEGYTQDETYAACMQLEGQKYGSRLEGVWAWRLKG